MAVAIARPLKSGNDAPVDLEVTLRSIVRLVEQALPSAVFGKLIDIRNSEVTVIACSDADTSRGLVAALGQNGFARRAASSLPSGVGISLDTIDIARLPDALEEARLALEFASTAEPLIHFSDIDLPELLIRRADRAAFRLIPEWASHFNPGNDDQSRELTRTVRVFAGCDFNVKQTARRLGVHVNTVYFRLNRIRKLTGVDPRTYAGVSGLLTVFRLLEVHRNSMKLSQNA
jgi:sugar diacid utilization regulator